MIADKQQTVQQMMSALLRLFLVVIKLFEQFFGVLGRLDADQHAHRLHVFLLAVDRRVWNTTQGHVALTLQTCRDVLGQGDV